jgi:acetyl esterase/lipase
MKPLPRFLDILTSWKKSVGDHRSYFKTSLLLGALAVFNVAYSSFAGNVTRGIEFAKVGDLSLKLDLHLPDQQTAPLIVYVHGGAWRGGVRDSVPFAALLKDGFAIASVDYRLSTQALFPAQAHDIKAAIRFLRSKQTQLGIDSRRIVIAGSSAGGHLAALAGVTNRHKELEGTVGDCPDQSSDVQGIVSFYGGSNLTSILSQSTEHGVKMRLPALQLLLGGPLVEKADLARLASPVFHIDANDPPLLLIHGDADPQMPPEQSRELAAAYEKAKVPVKLVMIPGAVHGGPQFYDEERLGLVKDFISRNVTK